MKGQGFLKVTSILMIIGGVISIIVSVIAVAGVGALVALGAGAVSGMGLLYCSTGLLVVASVIELIAGIKGVGACSAPIKAAACVKWGVIVAALSVISMIVGLIGGSDFSIVNLLLNLILPALYVYGAIQMKNGAMPQ